MKILFDEGGTIIKEAGEELVIDVRAYECPEYLSQINLARRAFFECAKHQTVTILSTAPSSLDKVTQRRIEFFFGMTLKSVSRQGDRKQGVKRFSHEEPNTLIFN